MQDEQLWQYLEQEDIASIQHYDEFKTFQREEKGKLGALKYYKEGTMTFKPTYKYEAMKSEYDMKREPAYTDRIFFEARYPLPQQNPLMNIYYGDVQYHLSDHMPITGLFEAKIKVQNQD